MENPTLEQAVASISPQASEELMCRILIEEAKIFYADPKNVRAFEAWLKNKEESTNGTNQN